MRRRPRADASGGHLIRQLGARCCSGTMTAGARVFVFFRKHPSFWAFAVEERRFGEFQLPQRPKLPQGRRFRCFASGRCGARHSYFWLRKMARTVAHCGRAGKSKNKKEKGKKGKELFVFFVFCCCIENCSFAGVSTYGTHCGAGRWFLNLCIWCGFFVYVRPITGF